MKKLIFFGVLFGLMLSACTERVPLPTRGIVQKFNGKLFPLKIIFTQPSSSYSSNLIYGINVINKINKSLNSVVVKVLIPKGLVYINHRGFPHNFNIKRKKSFVIFKIGKMLAYEKKHIRMRMKYQALSSKFPQVKNSKISLEFLGSLGGYLKGKTTYHISVENNGGKKRRKFTSCDYFSRKLQVSLINSKWKNKKYILQTNSHRDMY